jgi:hypothetical protein
MSVTKTLALAKIRLLRLAFVITTITHIKHCIECFSRRPFNRLWNCSHRVAYICIVSVVQSPCALLLQASSF